MAPKSKTMFGIFVEVSIWKEVLGTTVYKTVVPLRRPKKMSLSGALGVLAAVEFLKLAILRFLTSITSRHRFQLEGNSVCLQSDIARGTSSAFEIVWQGRYQARYLKLCGIPVVSDRVADTHCTISLCNFAPWHTMPHHATNRIRYLHHRFVSIASGIMVVLGGGNSPSSKWHSGWSLERQCSKLLLLATFHGILNFKNDSLT